MALALFGASPEELAPPVGIWPDNWPVFEVFIQMGTQWRTGFNGAYGLDYGILPWLFKVNGIQDERRAFQDIRTMEGIALEEIIAQRTA